MNREEDNENGEKGIEFVFHFILFFNKKVKESYGIIDSFWTIQIKELYKIHISIQNMFFY